MKSIFIAAIIAAACSGVAVAGELKQEQKAAAPAVRAQVMSDAEMDRVTAGAGNPNPFTLILPNDPKFIENPGGHSNICINIRCL